MANINICADCRCNARFIERSGKIYKSPLDKYGPDNNEAKMLRDYYCHLSRSVEFMGVWDRVGRWVFPSVYWGCSIASTSSMPPRWGAMLILPPQFDYSDRVSI